MIVSDRSKVKSLNGPKVFTTYNRTNSQVLKLCVQLNYNHCMKVMFYQKLGVAKEIYCLCNYMLCVCIHYIYEEQIILLHPWLLQKTWLFCFLFIFLFVIFLLFGLANWGFFFYFIFLSLSLSSFAFCSCIHNHRLLCLGAFGTLHGWSCMDD